MQPRNLVTSVGAHVGTWQGCPVYPLRLIDIAEYVAHMRAVVPLQSIRNAIDGAPAEVARYLLESAWDRVEKAINSPADDIPPVRSVQSVAYLLWRALRHGNPAIELTAVADSLTEANFGEAIRLVTLAHGPPPGEPNPQSATADGLGVIDESARGVIRLHSGADGRINVDSDRIPVEGNPC